MAGETILASQMEMVSDGGTDGAVMVLSFAGVLNASSGYRNAGVGRARVGRAGLGRAEMSSWGGANG